MVSSLFDLCKAVQMASDGKKGEKTQLPIFYFTFWPSESIATKTCVYTLDTMKSVQ